MAAGRSILLDKHGAIIAGNKTAENAGAAGLGDDVLVVQTDGTKIIAVQRMDLDLADVKAKGLAIADNRTGQLSLDWDPAVLASFTSEIDLSAYWTQDELAALLPADVSKIEDDVVPEAPGEPVTHPGDVYELGDHRLICGDCRNVDTWGKLLGSSDVNLIVTSPPYADRREYDESSWL